MIFLYYEDASSRAEGTGRGHCSAGAELGKAHGFLSPHPRSSRHPLSLQPFPFRLLPPRASRGGSRKHTCQVLSPVKCFCQSSKAGSLFLGDPKAPPAEEIEKSVFCFVLSNSSATPIIYTLKFVGFLAFPNSVLMLFPPLKNWNLWLEYSVII